MLSYHTFCSFLLCLKSFNSIVVRKSGVTDHYALDDFHALHLARQSIKHLNLKKQVSVSSLSAEILSFCSTAALLCTFGCQISEHFLIHSSKANNDTTTCIICSGKRHNVIKFPLQMVKEPL